MLARCIDMGSMMPLIKMLVHWVDISRIPSVMCMLRVYPAILPSLCLPIATQHLYCAQMDFMSMTEQQRAMELPEDVQAAAHIRWLLHHESP